MKVKFFEAVRSNINDIVEVANRNAVEDVSRQLRKNIFKLERQFQQAVHEGNLLLCSEIRREVNSLKNELKNL